MSLGIVYIKKSSNIKKVYVLFPDKISSGRVLLQHVLVASGSIGFCKSK